MRNPYDYEETCDICKCGVESCVCPECPICGVGDPEKCFPNGHYDGLSKDKFDPEILIWIFKNRPVLAEKLGLFKFSSHSGFPPIDMMLPKTSDQQGQLLLPPKSL